MKKLIILVLIPFALTSCLEDEGNYEYTKLDTVEISGLAESMRCFLLQKQNVTPNVVTSIPESSLEYIWRVGADTLATSKTFNYTFTEVPVSKEPLTFEVLNKQTNVRYSKEIVLTVVSPFSTGYAILTDGGKLAFQSFESGSPYYKDICQEVGADPLSGTPSAVNQLRYQNSDRSAWLDRISVTMHGGKSAEFDGVSMKHIKYYEDEFHITPVPKISYIFTKKYNDAHTVTIITEDGQVYVNKSHAQDSPDVGYYQYPLLSTANSYRLAPMIGSFYTNKEEYLTLDEQNHCFVSWAGSLLSSTITPLNFSTPEHKTIPGKLVWIAKNRSDSDGYAIVKNNGKYYLYVINYVFSYAVWGTLATMRNVVELPDDVINDNCVFDLSVKTPYLFVGSGNHLKAINLQGLNDIANAIIDVASYDGDITDMHFDYDVSALPEAEFSIAVSRNTGSSIYQIDPTIVNHGAIIKKFDGIQGRIVSFCRKI